MSSSRDFLDEFAKELSSRGYAGHQKTLTEVKESVETADYKKRVKQFYCRHKFQSLIIPYNNKIIRYKICSACDLMK